MKDKVEKLIIENQNERARLSNEISDLSTKLEVKKAERMKVKDFIDDLKELQKS